MPTMPTWIWCANSRAASPSRVKIAVPLPNSCSLIMRGGGLIGVGARHREHRPEDLFLVDLHVGGDVVEQRAAEEVAVLIALQLEAAAIDHQLGAFGDAGIDIALHLVVMLLGHQRAHLGFRIGAGADLQGADLRLELGHQRVGRLLADRHRDRDRHAALAGRTIGRAHQRIDRLVEIGIGHDDHVVLGAAQRLAALAGAGGGLIDVAGDRRRADEADGRDIGRVQDGVDRFLVAMDDVEHAGRQAGLLQPLGHQQRGGRIALRGLEDEAVAAGQRHGEHPHRHHGRES